MLFMNHSFPTPLPNDEKGIAHAFCKRNDYAIDVCGIKSLTTMLAEYQAQYNECVNYTDDQLTNHRYQGKKLISKSEIDDAIAYIKLDPQKYKIS
jgi:hypothetical protein